MIISLTKEETRSIIPIKDIERNNPPIDCDFCFIRHTDRNWKGSTYISGSDVSSFFQSIGEIYQEHQHVFKETDTKSISFLVDTSAFSKSHEKNDRLESFINDLSVISANGKEEKKKRTKLHSFTSKPENFGILFHWANQNPSHPLALECLLSIDDSMKQFRRTFDKKYDLSKVQDDNVFVSFNSTEEANIGKLMKYSYVSPIYFLYNAYFVYKWFGYYQHMMTVMGTKFLITQFIEEKKVKTDIYQGSSFPETAFAFQPLMGNFMGLVSHENQTWATGNLWLMNNHPNMEEVLSRHGINEELLRTVSEWAVNKITQEKKYPLPKKDWYTEVEWEFLREVGALEITFIDEKTVTGPNGEEELIIHGKIHIGVREYVIFPLISPSHWDGLSLLAKAIMTYSFCLYHDITVENAFSLIEDEDSTFTPLPLYNAPEKLIFSGRKMFSKAKGDKSFSKTSHQAHKKHKEHWVTFHFRKLKEGSTASVEAVEKAKKYRINIPRGYTFIDSHIRGKEAAELGIAPKISALDIFSKLFMR